MGSKGNSSTNTTNTYDPVASRKMAEIAERQQAIGEEQWEMYKQYFQEYEIQTAQANKELLPFITDASKATMEEQLRDLELNRPVKDAMRDQQLKELAETSPIASEFYQKAQEGVDAKDWMDSASADVAQGFAEQAGQIRRNIARMGGDPNDPAVISALAGTGAERAKAIGAARTTARRGADAETFNRLGTAMQVRGRATGLPGIQSTQGNGTQQFATPDVVGRALGGLQGAAGSQGLLANRVMGSSSKTSESSMDFSALAGMAGMMM
jgi:hypothetical protein